MSARFRRFGALMLLGLTLTLAVGCDAADIVFASLDLAGAIVDAAT